MTFTHLDSGTPEAAWRKTAAFERLPELQLPARWRLVVVAAHPDDESLGAGALMRLAHQEGRRVDVIVATDGEVSHPSSPSHTPQQLRDRRRQEVAAAVRTVAPDARLQLLGLPDGALASTRDRLSERVDAILRDGPEPLLVAPWCGDGHTDHEAAGVLAHELARSHGIRLLEYPIWLWHWATPDSPTVPWQQLAALRPGARTTRVKQRAMASHVSQTHPLSDAPGDEALLSPSMQQHFRRPEEVFVEHTAAMPKEFFTRFYERGPDPWGFETRWYEERKRAITLAALPRRDFRRSLELGCSTGVLTAGLATRTQHLLAVDIAEAPLRHARERVTDENVVFAEYATPREWPDGRFDLIVLSEVGYYWGDELENGIERILASLSTDGVLLACHWRHPVSEYPLTGDEVHNAIRARPELVRTVTHSEEDFLLDVFTRPPAVSVARATGLL